MRAGERQALIHVMKKGGGTNAHNEAVPAWVLHCKAWARLIPLRGYERDTSNERQSVAIYSARLDYLEGNTITPEMKVTVEGIDGLEFGIIAVHHDLVTRKTTDLQLGEAPRGA
jgi:head-tail adaptor